jgi:hypothetical protein
MPARGKHGKPKAGFPPFPPSLESRKDSGFPHSHSSDDWSLYKEKPSKAGHTAEPKTVNSEGGPKQTAEVGQNQLPNAGTSGIRLN